MMQYAVTRIVPKITQSQNNLEFSNPYTVPGMFTAIQIKHPNLPTCSRISTNLFFHFPRNPSGHFDAYIKFGIIMMIKKIKPGIFKKLILSDIAFSAFFFVSITEIDWRRCNGNIFKNIVTIIFQSVNVIVFKSHYIT